MRLDKVSYLCTMMLFRITPSLFFDKASCTRQFESKLSLHSLASLFPIKEGFFENLPSIVFTTLSVPLTGDRNLPYLFSKTYPSFLTVKEGSTSHLGLLPSGKKRETALLGAQNRYALRLAGHQSPRQILCGMGPPYYNLLLVCAMLCGMGPPGNSSL